MAALRLAGLLALALPLVLALRFLLGLAALAVGWSPSPSPVALAPLPAPTRSLPPFPQALLSTAITAAITGLRSTIPLQLYVELIVTRSSSHTQGFMNDPNGLFKDSKGVWHLYYQCKLHLGSSLGLAHARQPIQHHFGQQALGPRDLGRRVQVGEQAYRHLPPIAGCWSLQRLSRD